MRWAVLDRLDQLRPRCRQTVRASNIRCQLGEAIAQILDEGVTAGNDVDGRGLLEAAHGIESLFEVVIVALEAIIEVARAPMCHVR